MRYDHAELVRKVSFLDTLLLVLIGVASILGFVIFAMVGAAYGKSADAVVPGALAGGLFGGAVAGGLAWVFSLMLRICLQVALAIGEMWFYTSVLLKLTKVRMGVFGLPAEGTEDAEPQDNTQKPNTRTSPSPQRPAHRRPSVADCVACGCPLTPGIEFCEQCGHQS